MTLFIIGFLNWIIFFICSMSLFPFISRFLFMCFKFVVSATSKLTYFNIFFFTLVKTFFRAKFQVSRWSRNRIYHLKMKTVGNLYLTNNFYKKKGLKTHIGDKIRKSLLYNFHLNYHVPNSWMFIIWTNVKLTCYNGVSCRFV